MAQEFSSNYSTKSSQRQSFPIELIDVYMGSGDSVDSDTLFFNDSNVNIEFWPYRKLESKANYIALGLQRGGVHQNLGDEIQSVEVVLDNVSRTFSTLFTQVDLRGKRIVIRRVFHDALSASGDYELLFDGIIDTPQMSVEEGARIELKPSIQDSLLYKIPKQFYQVSCNNRFTDDYCANLHGPRTKEQLLQEKSGKTIDTVESQTVFTDSDLTAETSGDYDPAIIRCDVGSTANVGIRRSCRISGDTITLDQPFPSDIEVGDTYSIQRDCRKRYSEDCKNKFGNQVNFRGFRTLPKTIVQKG